MIDTSCFSIKNNVPQLLDLMDSFSKSGCLLESFLISCVTESNLTSCVISVTNSPKLV